MNLLKCETVIKLQEYELEWNKEDMEKFYTWLN